MLAQRRTQFVQILQDGDKLLQELDARRDGHQPAADQHLRARPAARGADQGQPGDAEAGARPPAQRRRDPRQQPEVARRHDHAALPDHPQSHRRRRLRRLVRRDGRQRDQPVPALGGKGTPHAAAAQRRSRTCWASRPLATGGGEVTMFARSHRARTACAASPRCWYRCCCWRSSSTPGRPRRRRSATIYFSRTVHVYKGGDVDVLGVKVGSITGVHPDGDRVKVTIKYNASQRIPANASAVILTPTLVADRVVQLTPAYTGGPVLADKAVIPLQKTGRAAGAGPGLQQPERARQGRRARTERTRTARCRTCSTSRRPTSTATATTSTRRSRRSRSSPARSMTTRPRCSRPSRICRRSRPCWPSTTPTPRPSPTTWRRSATS